MNRNDQKADRIARRAEQALANGRFAVAAKMFRRAADLYNAAGDVGLAGVALQRHAYASAERAANVRAMATAPHNSRRDKYVWHPGDVETEEE